MAQIWRVLSEILQQKSHYGDIWDKYTEKYFEVYLSRYSSSGGQEKHQGASRGVFLATTRWISYQIERVGKNNEREG